jgi:DNA topoisomerase-2
MDSVAEKYQSMTQVQHILSRPGMYMGSIHKDKHNIYIVEHNVKELITIDNLTTTSTSSSKTKKPKSTKTSKTSKKNETDDTISEISDTCASEISDLTPTNITSTHSNDDQSNLQDLDTTLETPSSKKTQEILRTRILLKDIILVPGFMSIIEEVLINANDQKYRLEQSIQQGQKDIKPLTEIRVNIKLDEDRITVLNNGEGIDIDKHPKTNLYVPQMIFSELLTSGNYDDTKERVTGGQNGIGVKLTNIYSKEFTIETVDHRRKLKYSQTFRNNMSIKEDPIITKYKGEPYTSVSFIPDYARFNMTDGLTTDICKLIEKRTIDLFASFTSGGKVDIYFNDTNIQLASFTDYMKLYLDNDYETFVCSPHSRWTIGACLAPNYTFQQVSFVNGIYTSRGGKHVEYILKQITKKLAALILKKRRTEVKETFIRDNLMLFINCIISNPSFDSQTKETLTNNSKDFGSECNIPDSFINDLAGSGIIDRVLALNEFQDSQLLKKTDGKKVKRIFDIDKLDDARLAGDKKHSSKCTLILTEGDSAKSMAVAGVSVIPKGYDFFGIFPLKGKLLNTRDMAEKDMAMNKEICDIKKILGLQEGVDYKDNSALRYGRVMLMTDADADGSHIKGLIMNFLSKYPSLMKLDGFITSLLTPIVKAKRLSGKKEIVESFYSLSTFNDWLKTNKLGKGWDIKYYKGLGTSTPKEAKEYFREFRLINYHWDELTDTTIDLAFNKERADDRKIWLSTYDENLILDIGQSRISFTDFINKDLIHFSNYDNIRSIPSMCDGLKPSQRKILYCCIKRNLNKEIKVAQLAGYVSENGAYHHGEASLQGAIVGMAQNFVGTNNINLLVPQGQYGSRSMGGTDYAAPRYIFTYLSPITQIIFNKLDNNLYDYIFDDGEKVEPKYYLPIIPMVLVNGSEGIGTGWSSYIPQFNPIDIIKNIYNMMDDKPLESFNPWYRGFTGSIRRISGNKWITKGKYQVINTNTVEITELPIGMWTQKYKEMLNEMILSPAEKNKSSSRIKKSPKSNASNLASIAKKKIPEISILKDYREAHTESTVRFELTIDPEFIEKSINQTDKTGITLFEKTFKLVSSISCANTINLHNENGKLIHYTNVEDILRDYYRIRLELYDKRHQYLITDMEEKLEQISVKARFILDIINKKIKINNLPKSEIISQLETNKYPKMLNDKLVNSTMDEFNDDKANYNFLIQLPIYNLTKEKVEELLAEKDNISTNLTTLKSKNAKVLWCEDLSVLEDEYLKFMTDYYDYMCIEPPSKTIRKTLNLTRKTLS